MHKREFVSILEDRLAESNPLIQVVLGPRQVGKTTGVQLLSGFDGRVFYVTADDALIHSSEWILEQWQRALELSSEPILIIDEIQKVNRWSEVIKGLWDSSRRKKIPIRVVLLGSSSFTLHQGLEESLAGRFEIIPAYHWGFQESHDVLGLTLDEFLVFGGYPEAARMKADFDRWQAYLKGSIIESVIGKDILRERTVRKPALFRQTFEIIASYPAQEISYNKLLGQIQEEGNVELVKHYLQLFEAAFLFRSLPKYSGTVVRQKASSPKILPLCPSLYTFQRGPQDLESPEIRGRVFEAVVGSELARLPGQLFYWRDGTHEVDFVWERGKMLYAIEVKSGRRKRMGGLTEFMKRFPRTRALFVTMENFSQFAKHPQKFIEANASSSDEIG